MSTPSDDGYRAKVDQQDGGPASHTEHGRGGDVNDVASGGVTERRNEDDDHGPDAGESDAGESDASGGAAEDTP